MNNTKNILLIAIIAATLVLGTTLTPMQSFADKGDGDNKKTKDFKSSISSKSQVDKDKSSAKQHFDQDNECYRGEKCQQSNDGQQIVGKDNEAKGFNDQSKNIPLTSTGTGKGTGTGTGNGNGNGDGNGPVITPPVDGACVAPLVLATVTIGGAAAVEVCIDPSLLGTLLPPVGGICVAPLVAATIKIGSSTIQACVLPGIFS